MSEFNCSALYVFSFLIALTVADVFMPSVILTIGVIVTIPPSLRHGRLFSRIVRDMKSNLLNHNQGLEH